PENRAGLAALLHELTATHAERFGRIDDLLVGLQLTHSGRFAKPNDERLEPRIAYHHPLLDAKLGIDPSDDSIVWTDDELERLIVFDFVPFASARRPETALTPSLSPGGRGSRETASPDGDDAQNAARSAHDTFSAGVGLPLPFAKLLPYEYGFGLNLHNPLE